MALEQELETYKKNLRLWKDNEGKFSLIHGEEIGAIFTSYEDAINGGYEKYRPEPFLVKQINAFEPVHFITRLVDPCHTLPSR